MSKTLNNLTCPSLLYFTLISVLGIPTHITRDLSPGVPKTRGYPNNCDIWDYLASEIWGEDKTPLGTGRGAKIKTLFTTLIPSVFVPLDQRSLVSSSLRSKERRLEGRECVIYMLQCNHCHKQYIGETKRRLKDRFNEHRRTVDKHTNSSKPTTVSEHFLSNNHYATDMQLIPLELVKSNRDSVGKAREAYLIKRGQTLEPLGLNKKDET